jgi:vacuolar-type H+-ATPase subunit F/Vma7
MQGKVAIIGSSDFVMPYSALGVDCFAVEQTDEQILQTAEKIVEGKYALVVVSETIAPTAHQVFEQFNTKTTPCVLVVPFTTESEGFAINNLSKLLKIATGIDILQNT